MAARVAGMTHTTKSPPNRRAVADAARKLLAPGIQQKVDLASALADAVLAALAAEDAFQAAEQHLQACRTAYAERYRAALSGGWSDAELTQLDLPVEALEPGPRRPPRRRTRVKAVADQPPAPADDGPPTAGHGAQNGRTAPADADPGAADARAFASAAAAPADAHRAADAGAVMTTGERRRGGTPGRSARSVDAPVPPRGPVCARFRARVARPGTASVRVPRAGRQRRGQRG